jgi:hypothetical protein
MILALLVIISVRITYNYYHLDKKNNVKNLVKIVLEGCTQYVIAVLIGLVFIFTQFTKNIGFNIFINFVVTISILLILRFICMGVLLKSSFPKLHLEIVKYLRIILLSIVGFTVSKNNFGYNELLISLMYIYLLSYTVFLINECSSSIIDKNRKRVSLRSEMPIHEIKDLYPSRRRQLDNFIEYYSMDENDKKSIAIRGAWGYGKTSFVNALKSSIKSETIHIIPSIDSSKKSMFIQLTRRLEEIFEKNGIYTGRGSNLDKYTKYILSLVSIDKTNLIGIVSGMLFENESVEFYELLNDLENDIQQIRKTEKKDILIIFDDMDRSFENDLKEVLQFFNIVLSLQGINTLFLFDNNQLRKKEISDVFINKYFDTLIDVCSLEHEEIVDYIEDNEIYFDSKFISSLHDHLKVLINKYCQSDRYFLKNKLDNLIEKYEKFKKNEELELEEVIKNLSNKIVNPRYIKNYYREVKRILMSVNEKWFNNQYRLSNDYSKGDWLECILSIVTLKVFFIDKYDEVLKLGSIKEILKSEELSRYSEYVLGLDTFSMSMLGNSTNREKEAIMGFIIFNREKKSINQSISEQLKNGRVKEENIIPAFESIVWDESKRLIGTKVLIDSICSIDIKEGRNEVFIDFISSLDKKSSNYREIELEIFQYTIEKCDALIKEISLTNKNKLSKYIENIIHNYVFGTGGILKNYLENLSIIKNEERTLQFKQFSDTVLDLKEICYKYYKDDYESVEGNSDIERIIKFIEKTYESTSFDSNAKSLITIYYDKLINQLKVIEFLESYTNESFRITSDRNKYRNSIKSSGYENVEVNSLNDEIEYIKNKINNMDKIKTDDDIFEYFASLCKDIHGNKDLIIEEKSIDMLKKLYKETDSKLVEKSKEPNYWGQIYFNLLSVENRLSNVSTKK